jgi:hypothetical protein
MNRNNFFVKTLYETNSNLVSLCLLLLRCTIGILLFVVMINMLVATLVTLPNGFMGPTGAQTAFIFLVIDIVILRAGPMAYSVDAPIFKNQGNT